MSFLAQLMPTQGTYCVVGIPVTGHPRHYWCPTLEQAEKYIATVDQSAMQVYIAQATFKDGSTHRYAANALYMRNFFLDVDCGENKPYATQKDGLQAIFEFCKKASLPAPAVVNSGNGLYAHWLLEADMPSNLWKQTAILLQELTLHHGLMVDAACTSDCSRILRPVGAHHKKDRENLREVKLLYVGAASNTFGFAAKIQAAYEAIGKKLPSPKAPKDLNESFLTGLYEDRPSSAVKIAQNCAQIAHIRAVKGDVGEPLWYAAVGLLRHTAEAPEIIHEWSSGHVGYDQAATDKKIAQHTKAGVGPTTCVKFSAENPALCKGCPHNSKISTPLVLGREAPAPLPQTTETQYPAPPRDFVISAQGVYCKDEDEKQVLVYRYPLWVASLNVDYFGTSMTLRYQIPNVGWAETTLAINKMEEPKSFFAALADAQIYFVGKKQKERFMTYIKLFMDELHHQKAAAKLSAQMGWSGEGLDQTFIHGASIYNKSGETTKVGYSAAAPEFVRNLKSVGTAEAWAEATRILDRPGMESLAFGFICTAFGSPLVKFTGYDGILLCLIGGSGLGKTLVSRYGVSAWGADKSLTLAPRDTANAVAGRFGVHNNLPVYIDEISNIDPNTLSDLAYNVTTGRDKLRMNRNAVEKNHINRWSLLATSSSNHSLIEKLGAIKGDAGAEINRIFEYDVVDGITSDDGRVLFDTFTANYGAAGEKYAKYLVEKQHLHFDNLRKIAMQLETICKSPPDERFWIMTVAVAYYGGLIANKLGLCHIDIDRVRTWALKTIKSMRKYKASNAFNPISFLGSLLDRNVSSIIVVSQYDPHDTRVQPALKEARIHQVARIELDTQKLWISFDTIKKELHHLKISTRKLQAMLTQEGLMNPPTRITLGRGTLSKGISQLCWEFDLTHPQLSELRQAALQEG